MSENLILGTLRLFPLGEVELHFSSVQFSSVHFSYRAWRERAPSEAARPERGCPEAGLFGAPHWMPRGAATSEAPGSVAVAASTARLAARGATFAAIRAVARRGGSRGPRQARGSSWSPSRARCCSRSGGGCSAGALGLEQVPEPCKLARGAEPSGGRVGSRGGPSRAAAMPA